MANVLFSMSGNSYASTKCTATRFADLFCPDLGVFLAIPKTKTPVTVMGTRLLELLLGAELVRMPTLSLTAVCCARWQPSLERRVSTRAESRHGLDGKPYVALAADHLVAVELAGQSLQRRLDYTTTETEDKVEGRLLFSRISLPLRSEHSSEADTS